MRTTVIPAQITTVEDKIAGNFNFTQIFLLIASLFIAVFIYAVFPERMHFTLYKIPLMAIEFLICCILALRIKGKVVINWLFILSSYYFRPMYYVFNKNDLYLREVIQEAVVAKKRAAKAKHFKTNEAKLKTLTDKDLSFLQRLLHDPKAGLIFRFNKEGGVDATWQVKN